MQHENNLKHSEAPYGILTIMRVLDPKKLNSSAKKHHRKTISRPVILFAVIALVGGAGTYAYVIRKASPGVVGNTPVPALSTPEEDPFDITARPLKHLKGDGFKDLYQSVALPNTQDITDPPVITGNDKVDTRIRVRAEARGYKLSRIPMGAIVKIEGEPRLEDDDLLQPLAAQAWYRMRETARREGYPVSLLSAYRSPKYQQDLFKERLLGRGVTLSQLASGAGDGAIDATLAVTAVPGYSRHHTGYTIDLWCEDGSATFLESKCYDWISNNGYQKGMEFGWIPSYPEGASEQGPEPEPWEYVWVGDSVRQL